MILDISKEEGSLNDFATEHSKTNGYAAIYYHAADKLYYLTDESDAHKLNDGWTLLGEYRDGVEVKK